jgi:prophage antirepressor-like protein
MNITPFYFEGAPVEIRTDENGEIWFAADEVCAILEYGNPRQALETHVDRDDVQKLDTIDRLGRTQQVNHVNESGLYALIFGSTKPKARTFKRWVTSEVLPSIRKTGRYAVEAAHTNAVSALFAQDNARAIANALARKVDQLDTARNAYRRLADAASQMGAAARAAQAADAALKASPGVLVLLDAPQTILDDTDDFMGDLDRIMGPE